MLVACACAAAARVKSSAPHIMRAYATESHAHSQAIFWMLIVCRISNPALCCKVSAVDFFCPPLPLNWVPSLPPPPVVFQPYTCMVYPPDRSLGDILRKESWVCDFPLHYFVFRQTASHLPHETNVEQIFSLGGVLCTCTMRMHAHAHSHTHTHTHTHTAHARTRTHTHAHARTRTRARARTRERTIMCMCMCMCVCVCVCVCMCACAQVASRTRT